MIAPMMMTERPGERRFLEKKPKNRRKKRVEAANQNFSDICKIRTALSLRSAYLSIVLSLTVSLHFLLIPVLPLLVRELGWTEAGFNATNGGDPRPDGARLPRGRTARTRFGGKKIIIYAALGTAFVTALWGVLTQLWGSTIWMVGVWSLKNFGWSVVMIDIYSLMMKVTWGEVGGTQFTGYMAMMNLSAIIGCQLTGRWPSASTTPRSSSSARPCRPWSSSPCSGSTPTRPVENSNRRYLPKPCLDSYDRVTMTEA